MSEASAEPSARPAPPIPQTFEEKIARYVLLRDKIKEADDKHKEKCRPAKEYLEALNNAIQEQLLSSGGESVKTAAGTAYLTAKKSATIADPTLFRDYVIQNGDWDLADWRANPSAVEDYLNMNKQLPPGVNFSVTNVVGVRRA